MEQKAKHKTEFSKKLVIAVGVVTILVTAFTCYMVYETKDISALSVLIPAIFAELAAGTVGYYAKAKAENVIKIGKAITEEKVNVEAIKVASSLVNGNEIPAVDMTFTDTENIQG